MSQEQSESARLGLSPLVDSGLTTSLPDAHPTLDEEFENSLRTVEIPATFANNDPDYWSPSPVTNTFENGMDLPDSIPPFDLAFESREYEGIKSTENLPRELLDEEDSNKASYDFTSDLFSANEDPNVRF